MYCTVADIGANADFALLSAAARLMNLQAGWDMFYQPSSVSLVTAAPFEQVDGSFAVNLGQYTQSVSSITAFDIARNPLATETGNWMPEGFRFDLPDELADVAVLTTAYRVVSVRGYAIPWALEVGSTLLPGMTIIRDDTVTVVAEEEESIADDMLLDAGGELNFLCRTIARRLKKVEDNDRARARSLITSHAQHPQILHGIEDLLGSYARGY